jgi:hypothetical protein
MIELINHTETEIKRLEKIARLFIEKFWEDFTEDEKQKITEWTGIEEVE